MAKAMAIEMEHNRKMGVAKNTARINMVVEKQENDEADVSQNEKPEPQKGLDPTAANRTNIQHVGWVKIDDTHDNITVPFLVTKTSEQCDSNIPSYIDFVYNNAINDDNLRFLKTSKKAQLIPNGESVTVCCRANVGIIRKKTPVLFEPYLSISVSSCLAHTLLVLPEGKSPCVPMQIHNPSRHDIFLKSRTIPGTLKLVISVTPLEVKCRGIKEEAAAIQNMSTHPKSDTKETSSTSSRFDISKFDLSGSGLTPAQCSRATQMLNEEAETFDTNDNC
eukprot:gene20773-22798_t